jgi:hypothetical protein
MAPANSAATGRSIADLLILAGLAAGAVFGLAGTLVAEDTLRQMLWGIDGLGVIVATALLAVRHIRHGDELVAAGFLVFAMGESLLVGGLAGGLEAGRPLFAGGVALWAVALALTSIPPVFPAWTRATGGIGSLLFFVVAFQILGGVPLLATAAPLPFLAYPFVILTFAGWAMQVLNPPRLP